MRQREPKPALPNLERLLVDMATTQARGAEGRRSRRRPGRRIALGAAVTAVGGALLMVAILGGGGAGLRPERASAADLGQVAALLPRLQQAGPWQITGTELSPGGGRIEYRSEEGADHLFHATESEIQWRSASIAERAGQLESEGFAFAGRNRTEFARPSALRNGEFERFYEVRTVGVYVSREDGKDDFLAAGLWHEGRRTYEYRATVVSIWELERLMERIEFLTEPEWFIALQAGGAKWLADTGNGTIKKVEEVKVGETPNGEPIYREQALIGSSPGKKLDFKSALPIIYREGDRIRLVIEQPPEGIEQPGGG